MCENKAYVKNVKFLVYKWKCLNYYNHIYLKENSQTGVLKDSVLKTLPYIHKTKQKKFKNFLKWQIILYYTNDNFVYKLAMPFHLIRILRSYSKRILKQNVILSLKICVKTSCVKRILFSHTLKHLL